MGVFSVDRVFRVFRAGQDTCWRFALRGAMTGYTEDVSKKVL